MTYIATLSHLRRINTPIEKTGKLVQPRKLHATQWGIVCPAETPEGASVGLVKNMALLTNVTVATPSEPVRHALAELGLVPHPDGPTRETFSGKAPVCVFVNGDPVGTHDEPPALYAALKKLKRSGAISVFTSIAWNVTAGEIWICTEGGRFVRPLLVVDRSTQAPVLLGAGVGALLASAASGSAAWHDLVLAGAVEYIDADEANCTRIGFLGDVNSADCDLLEVTFYHRGGGGLYRAPPPEQKLNQNHEDILRSRDPMHSYVITGVPIGDARRRRRQHPVLRSQPGAPQHVPGVVMDRVGSHRIA